MNDDQNSGKTRDVRGAAWPFLHTILVDLHVYRYRVVVDPADASKITT